MGATRWTLGATAIVVLAAGGCGSGGRAAVDTVASVDSVSANGGAQYPSWCRPMIDDLKSARLDPVDDGIGTGSSGQPAYQLDACYWSGGNLFVGRQDGTIGPWKKLAGVGDQALASAHVAWVFWIRNDHEYVVGASGDYCHEHDDCRAQIARAAQLIDHRLAGS